MSKTQTTQQQNTRKQILDALVDYVIHSGAFILPEDPENPGAHDWKAVALTEMETTVQIGKHVIRRVFPDNVVAWGQKVPKGQCALVLGSAMAFSSNAINKRAYLVRAGINQAGEVVAIPLALFSHGPRGWFLSSVNAPPRFGVEQNAQTTSAAGTRQRPLDNQTLGMILAWLNNQDVVSEDVGAGEDFLPLDL